MRKATAHPGLQGVANWIAKTITRGRAHRPVNENEANMLRLASRKPDNLVYDNPGARVEPDFLSSEEESELAECGLDIMKTYGISHIDGQQRSFMMSQMKHLPLPKEHLAALINMRRVTGRYESQMQKLAPWKHGDDFRSDQLPGPLRRALERIQSCDSFNLGKPRDITLNYRNSYFYRLDPHIDPYKDGDNVFILGTLGGTVLSLSPGNPTMHPLQFLHMDQRRVSERSWQLGKDIDVDLTRGSLLHLHGRARSEWHHGIRLGVTKMQLSDFGTHVDVDEAAEEEELRHGIVRLYDWWGNMGEPRPRNPERLSFVFAFADP